MEYSPHQSAFIETALNPNSKQFILLYAEPGMGKTTAMVGLIGQLLEEKPIARILVLGPAALAAHWLAVLNEKDIAAYLVDRYKFRELLQAGKRNEVWPKGIATILSDDFAKQDDVSESLVNIKWDLVIADEAHRFNKGSRAKLLNQIKTVARKVVLASIPDMLSSEIFSTDESTVVTWQAEKLLNFDGKALVQVNRPTLNEIPFIQSKTEHELSEKIKNFSRFLQNDSTQGALISEEFLSRFTSSNAALEISLRNLTFKANLKEEFKSYISETQDIIDTLESIRVDSKLGVFRNLMNTLVNGDLGASHVCLITDYVSTLYYLAAETEECEIGNILLYGSMPQADREQSLTNYRMKGGILIATKAMIFEGLNLAETTDLILYDLPPNKVSLQKVLGSFNRFGRTNQLNIHVLYKADDGDNKPPEPIRILREICVKK